MYSTLLTQLENGIFIITINRPDKLNALNKDVIKELDEVFDEVSRNNQIKSVIITGAGPKSFVAGADITEFNSLSKQQGIDVAKKGQEVFFKIENSSKPVMAAVNGFALGGGCELAMACHFRIASDNAKFGQPEVNLGLIPGYGGTQRLTALVGKGKAMEMILSANTITAAEALQCGLINYVVSSDELLPKSKSILEIINTKAPVAVAQSIASINAYSGEEGFKTEINNFGKCFDTEDLKEGIKAFSEKRKANFSGK